MAFLGGGERIMKYIYFIIFTLLCYLALKLCGVVFRYSRLVYRLSKLKKIGAFVKYNLQKRSKNEPDIIISLENKIYLLRCFNGGGLLRTVHFVSNTLAVSFIPMRARISRRKSLGRGYKSTTLLSRLKRIRAIEYDENSMRDMGLRIIKNENGADNTKRILLFTKEAGEVTALTEAGTGIKCAYTGDKVFDYLIFTPDTFTKYIEREKTHADIEKEGYLYFSD